MIYGTMQNINEAKRAVNALRASEARFRGIYEHALAGIILIEWEGKVESANAAFCNLLGYREEEIRGHHFGKLIHPDDVAADTDKGRQLRADEVRSFPLCSQERSTDLGAQNRFDIA